MSRPIPKRLEDQFIGFMAHIYEDDDLPDGAWFAMLEEQAREFMRLHKLRGDENDAAHQLLDLMNERNAPADAAREMLGEDGDNAWFHDPDMGAR